MLNLVVALAPVVAFLTALWLMDSFRLVRPRAVIAALAYGAIVAGVSSIINGWMLRHVAPGVVTGYVAPVLEETLKAALIVAMIATSRIGFLVDAAVEGFAVGTGFALVENVWYLQTLTTGTDATPTLWIVRGLGTAVLQGATTTIFAIVSRTLLDRFGNHVDRRRSRNVARVGPFLPGWVAAVVIHGAFNRRLLPPVAQMLLLLVLLPLIVLLVFDRSERATREWIGAGLDLDLELLRLINSEDFAYTRFGRYLQELRARMPKLVVADMFCLLRLELELAVQAKAYLIAREAGLDLPVSNDLEATLAERRYLHQSIGKAGLLALKPLQVTSHRDKWHRHLLQGRVG